MILVALVLIVIVAIVVIVSRRRSGGSVPRTSAIPHGSGGTTTVAAPAYVEALLERWRAAGLLTESAVESIRSYERSAAEAHPAPEHRSRIHAIAEAIGYLGGMLGLGGIIVLLAEFWSDFPDALRVAIPALASIMFVVAGVVVPESRSSAMLRLRTFLWILAVACAAVAAWVFSDVVLGVDEGRQQWLAVGVTTAVVSAALWAGKIRPIHQFLALAGVAITIGTAVGEFASSGVSGIALWIAAGVLLAVSMPRTGPRATVDVLAGSIGIVVGAYLTITTWMGPGLVFVLVTGVVLVMPAAVSALHVPAPFPLIMGIAGALALAQGTPASIVHFAHRAGLATGLVVWIAGVALFVVVAARLVRLDVVVRGVAGALLIGGAAVTGAQSVGFATVFGLATAVALIAVGARPGSALMSVFGLIGLLIYIPWTIGHFFPGEGRVPLLIIVSGLVLVGVAVALTRVGGRLRGEIAHRVE